MTDDDLRARDALVDGVADAMREQLIEWICPHITQTSFSGQHLTQGVGLGIRSDIGVDLGERVGYYVEFAALLTTLRALSPLMLLRLVDYIAASGDTYADPAYAPDDLIEVLSRNGSKWTARWDGDAWRLQEVVPDGVQVAVESQFDAARGGVLLRRAWGLAYGVDPNGSEAYRMAVKAVEASAIPVIQPNDLSPTMGTVIARVRDQGWTVPFHENRGYEGNSHEALLRLMQTLWQGQHDRHGAGSVTVDEARAALLGAATLVGWFESGAVTRREQVGPTLP